MASLRALWMHSLIHRSRRGWVSRRTRSELEAQCRLISLEKFRQIEVVESAGTILHASQLDDAAFWGLIDALRDAGIDLIEVRREVGRPPSTRSSP